MTTTSHKNGALFDLDGVLIDSESLYTEFWDGIEQLYPTGIPNYAIAIKGTTLEEIMKRYSDEAVKADIMRRIRENLEQMVFETFPGVIEFLEMLREAGIPRAIVTSSGAKKMEELYRQLPGFKDYFDAVIDSSKVTRSKPDPQGYLLGAEAIGCRPEDCWVFEDSLQGLEAGRRSGATVIGIATTYPAEELEGKADLIVSSVATLTLEQLLSTKLNRKA